MGDLIQNECITVNRQRGGANEITVHLPSEISACKELIEKEEVEALSAEKPDESDYYSDPERRLMVLDRDKRKCIYCLIDVSEDSFVLDYIIPVPKVAQIENSVWLHPAKDAIKESRMNMQFNSYW